MAQHEGKQPERGPCPPLPESSGNLPGSLEACRWLALFFSGSVALAGFSTKDHKSVLSLLSTCLGRGLTGL